jgi:Ca2+-binding RTX toxin-like protein
MSEPLHPTAWDQYFVELINRSRLDPGWEARRLAEGGWGIQDPHKLDAGPRQPLAWNAELSLSAMDRSSWTKARNGWGDEQFPQPSPAEFIRARGYPLGEAPVAGEISGEFSAIGHFGEPYGVDWFHESFFRWNWRSEMLLHDAKEIGIGMLIREYQVQGGRTAFSAYPTVHVAAPATNEVFITGVAYDDRNGNRFYTVGEGLGGIAVGASDASTESAAAGGYSLAVEAGRHVVTFEGEGLSAPMSAAVTVGSQNVKLDVMGDGALASSVDVELLDGVSYLKLLGFAGISAQGSDGNETIHGNRGDNDIRGGAGDDRINGGGGHDRMWGGAGNDLFVLDDEADLAIEFAGEGMDTVHTTLGSTVLPENIEILFTAGDRDTEAVGNGLDNALTGNARVNLLYGLGGDDRLSGGGGDDILEGGAGDDRLTGGAGADMFVFASPEHGMDVVTDFSAEDGDRIYVSGLMHRLGHKGDPFEDGTLRLDQQGGDALLVLDAGEEEVAMARLSGVSAADLSGEGAFIW